MSSIAYATTDTIPKHQAFVYIGMNYAGPATASYSVETGSWGMSSNTSFSVVADVVPHGIKEQTTQWLGIKAYYTFHSEDKLCYMFYIAPKKSLNSTTELIEFGFNPNYTLSKNILLGIILGNQSFTGNEMNVFMSAGLVFLFNKQNEK